MARSSGDNLLTVFLSRPRFQQWVDVSTRAPTFDAAGNYSRQYGVGDVGRVSKKFLPGVLGKIPIGKPVEVYWPGLSPIGID